MLKYVNYWYAQLDNKTRPLSGALGGVKNGCMHVCLLVEGHGFIATLLLICLPSIHACMIMPKRSRWI